MNGYTRQEAVDSGQWIETTGSEAFAKAVKTCYISGDLHNVRVCPLLSAPQWIKKSLDSEIQVCEEKDKNNFKYMYSSKDEDEDAVKRNTRPWG